MGKKTSCSANANQFSVCVASTLRVVAIALAPDGQFKSWGDQPLALWTSIETNVAIMCSCLPTLRPLATSLWLKLKRKRGTQLSLYSFSGKDEENQTERTQDKNIFVTTTHTVQESSSEFERGSMSLPSVPPTTNRLHNTSKANYYY